MTDWHNEKIKGTMPFYAQLYPCIALVTRGKLLDWWIHKHYKAFNVVCKIYKPSNTPSALQYAWKQGMANAVGNWQGFDDATKKYYNDRSKPIGDYGYHRYISLYLHGYIPTMADKVISTKLVAADGSGDFTDIQAGIDALPAGGGMVFIKEGTYTLTAKLTIAKSNVVLAGQGPATIITLANAVNDDILEIGHAVNNITDVIVADLKLSGNRANQNAGEGIDLLANVDRISIFRCWLDDIYNRKIDASLERTYLRVEDCLFTGVSNRAIICGDGSKTAILNNIIYDQVSFNAANIDLETETDFIVEGNQVYGDGSANTGHGIFLQNSSRGVISGNYVSGMKTGIYDMGVGTDISFVGNTIYDTYSTGLDSGSSGGTLTGNVVKNSGGIGIIVNKDDNVISDNIVIGSALVGIKVTYARNIISNNKVSLSQNHGINLSFGSYCLITGNHLYNNGQALNNTYSDIYLGDSAVQPSTYNHISDNFVYETGATKTKYGYSEFDANSNYNSIWNNRIIGPATASILITGANDDASDNLIT